MKRVYQSPVTTVTNMEIEKMLSASSSKIVISDDAASSEYVSNVNEESYTDIWGNEE